VVTKSAKSGAAVVLYAQFDLPYSNSYIIEAITMISMFLTLDRLVMTNVLIPDAKVNATNANAFIINANAFIPNASAFMTNANAFIANADAIAMISNALIVDANAFGAITSAFVLFTIVKRNEAIISEVITN
jgi:hypothetical protein